MLHRNDVISICSFVVALGSGLVAGSPLAAALDTVTLGHGQYALSVVALVAFAAGSVLRVLSNPTPVPASSQAGESKSE